MASYTIQGSDGKSYTVEYPEQQSSLESSTPKQPGLLETIGTNLSRPGASVRERIRTLGNTGDLSQANQAADEAWKNPSSSKTFQQENLQKTNNLIDKIDPNMGTVGRYVAGTIPSTAGLAEDFVTDPVQMGITLATEGILKGASEIPFKGKTLGWRASELPVESMLSSSEGKSAKATDFALKARDKAVKLYPNQQGSLEDIRNTAEQTSKYISPSKNYEDVANQLEMAKGINAGERQKLYDSGSLSESRTQHDPIMKLIGEYESSPLANTREGQNNIKMLKEIQTSDVEHLNSQSPEKLNDPNFYQQQKEIYQSKANKAGAYKENPTESLKADAYRAMSEGYQGKTRAVSEGIQPLDTEQKGLIQSHNMAREMAKNEALGLKPSLAKEAAGSISGSPIQTGARFVRKGLLDRLFGSDAKGLTKDISGLMAKSDRAQALADAISAMKQPESVSVEYPKQLEAPKPSQPIQIGMNKRSIASRMLPDAVGGKPVINAESNQIDMPEYTQSDLERLARKYGVPERNIRSITKESDIPSIDISNRNKPILQNKGNLTPKKMQEILTILKRRNTNFGGSK